MFSTTSMVVWGIVGLFILGFGKTEKQPITTIKFKEWTDANVSR